MRRSLDLTAQLPERGLARAATIAALAVGGAVALGLTALIVVFVVTWVRA
jgi:hypothetical protein